MPWRVISNGTDQGTYIRHTQTGATLPLQDASEIVWRIRNEGIAELVVTYRGVDIQAIAEAVQAVVEKPVDIVPAAGEEMEDFYSAYDDER